ncbi:AMP-binding protein, partial [Enterovibrio norvegicus]
MAATSSHASPSQDNPDLYLIFTSGSTGNPKGVSVETHNLLNYLETTRDEFGICADDVLSHISPLSFDFSIHEIFIALFNQAAIAVLRENDKFNFSGYLLRHAVSVWASVPSTLAYLNKTRQLNP